jgi:hypothetical protein
MENSLNKIFSKNNNIIIGAIHFAPLFGYENFPGYEVILKNALEDLSAFQNGGFDAVIIENNYDIPHKVFIEKENAELMEKLGKKIKEAATVPLGVSVLWNDYKSALLIAKNIGAEFIRVPVFVDSVKTNYGEILANPESVLEYRKNIGAENIFIFTDIHVKHAQLLEDNLIEESAIRAIKFGSDALIITGKWTGDAPDLNELKKVRETVGNFPILIGSGAGKGNIKELLEFANGAIISTSIKKGDVKENEVNIKNWQQRIDQEKVKELIRASKA